MKKRLLLELIAQYHPDPEKGKQKFNELLELNKISNVKENIVTMFLEFSFHDNFVEWIPTILENQSTYHLKPSESDSKTIREEYLYRKGYRQGFVDAMSFTSKKDQEVRKRIISSWAFSSFMRIGTDFHKVSEKTQIEEKLKIYLTNGN